ncbi:MAG: NapC/NirT cytochrome c domain protein [Bacillales bacterium]|jgi:cytochrome c-type protein NapC|nr:NapC/NirT cytochrome c domain protein [Bacillales bacterium]
MGIFRKRGKDQASEQPTEKKMGMIAKLRAVDWKDPANRWKLGFSLVAAFILMIAFTAGALAGSSTPWFCMNVCHEMAPEAETYKISSHNQIACVDCHIPPGAKNFITHKVAALGEVYKHVTKTQPNPIATKHPIENVTCLRCHSENRLISASGDIVANHDGHVKKDIPCISCHSGVAHGKIVERGISTNDTYDFWTKDNVEKLVGDASMKPNMGTCIECHAQVNAGKEPWKEAHGEEGGHGEEAKKDSHSEAKPVSSNEKTQTIILQAIGKQKANVKISMECKTCHLQVATPKTHQNKPWPYTHGGTAEKELPECINCHQDSKWIKTMDKQDIRKLINHNDSKIKYKPNMIEVKTESRDSKFCSTCHSNRPVTHGTDGTWLTSHPGRAQQNRQIQGCLTCHDYNKIEGTKSPTDVYCKFCHRTGLKQVEGIVK